MCAGQVPGASGGTSELQNAEGVWDRLSGKKRGEWFLGRMG